MTAKQEFTFRPKVYDLERRRHLCITIPTIAAVGGGIASASIGASAAKKASQTQAKAAKDAQASTERMYQQTRTDLAPYRDLGNAAKGTYMDLLGLGSGGMDARMKALENTPGYQFALQQGLQATQNGFAAQGLAQSGPALKGAANYATGLASTTYQSVIGDYYNAMGLGESAAAQTGALGATLQGQSNAAGTAAGAATAAGTIGAANAMTGGINSALSGVSNAFMLQALGGGGGNSNNPFSLMNANWG